MSTALYYTEDHKHTLPSLAQIMPQSHPILPHMSSVPYQQSQFQNSQADLFSNSGLQPSSVNTTPASSFSGQSSSGYMTASDIPNVALKCTCKSNANRIPRPRNAFILFRQKHHQSVLDEGSVARTNPEVSRELGRRWRALSTEDKDYWNNLAEEEKVMHAKKYPNYRYTPRRNSKVKGCEACRQKSARQHLQTQFPSQQLLQLQQEQYQQYLQLQQQQQQQQQQMVPQAQSLQLLQQAQIQLQQMQLVQLQQLGVVPTSQAQGMIAGQMMQNSNGSLQVAPPHQPYVQYIPFQQNFQMTFGNENMLPIHQQDQKLLPLSAPISSNPISTGTMGLNSNGVNTSIEMNPQFQTNPAAMYDQRYYVPGMEVSNYQS